MGITSKINVHGRDAVVLAFPLEFQYQLLIVRPRPSLSWVEQAYSANLSSSSPASGSTITDSFPKIAASFPPMELVHLQVAG